MEVDWKSIETVVASSLPLRARWIVNGTSLDFDFSLLGQGLRTLPDEPVAVGDEMKSDLLIFGQQDFAEGGGARPWLCVRKRDGWVYGFDPDEDKPLFLLNSSIERFVATFQFLNEHLRKNEPLQLDCESHLRIIDPEAYPMSEWRLLAESLRSP
jgi:hypothetical protein